VQIFEAADGRLLTRPAYAGPGRRARRASRPFCIILQVVILQRPSAGGAWEITPALQADQPNPFRQEVREIRGTLEGHCLTALS